MMILSHVSYEVSMMFKLLSIIFIAFHGVQSIRNGLYAEPGDFPYVVAIRNFNSYHCSGILINEFNVLTVAHMVDVVSAHLDLTVVIGNTKIANTVDRPYDAYLVKNVYLHPQFAPYIPERGDEKFFVNDVAVLQLRTKLTSNVLIGLASLMNAEAPWGPTTDCSIISWSRSPQGYMQLMWDKIKYVSDEESQSQGTNFVENQKGFSDLLELELMSTDDIGSPIICNNQVVGLVVKEGEHHQVQKPSTLLFIYKYLPFIWEIMAEGLFDIHPWKFPYVATIWKLAISKCGGFIVDETHIVTTGSCSRKINIITGRVTVGYTTMEMSDPHINWLSIKTIEEHPLYRVKPGSWPIDKSPNDIAVITLTERLVWSPTIAPLVMEQSENFAGGQVCQVLRWVPTPKYSQKSLRQLTLKRSVVVIWNKQQLECLLEAQEETSFWGRTPYVMPIAEQIDGGNPIICGNDPIGMVLQDSKPREWDGPKSARFHKIQSFIEFINIAAHRT